MAIGVYQFVIASLRSVHFSLTNRLGVNIICHWALYSRIIKMDFTLSETSKGQKSLLYDGFAFRIDRVLKSGDAQWKTVKEELKQTNIPLLSLMETATIRTNPIPEKYRSRLSVQLLSGKQHLILQHAPLNWSTASC